MQNNVCSDIFWCGDIYAFTCLGEKNENFQNCIYTKYVEKSEVITSSTHSFAYVVRHHVTRIKSEIILMAQEARKTLGKLNFKLSIISFLGGGGKVIGKLYIDLKHRIWRVQICQKEKYCFFNIIWLSWWRTTYIHID